MKNTNNTFRQSKVAKILSLISESGILEEVIKNMQDIEEAMGGQSFDMKKMFFKSLTPMGREAFKLGYQIIDNKYAVLMEHEDKAIRDNWYAHFIEYHNQVLEMLKEGGNTIFTYVIKEYGDVFINDVFRQDTRSLEEIFDNVGMVFVEAEILKKQHDSKLKEKLHTQLQDVIATLNELTVGNNKKVNNFEIHTEGAVFEIKTHSEDSEDSKSDGCGCGESGDLDELFEKMVKSLFNKKN